MSPRELSKYLAAFKVEVSDRAKEVDPENDHHWLALTVGWGIGKGMTPDQANDFALHVRYHTDLG
jgi:hypothetical protein